MYTYPHKTDPIPCYWPQLKWETCDVDMHVLNGVIEVGMIWYKEMKNLGAVQPFSDDAFVYYWGWTVVT